MLTPPNISFKMGRLTATLNSNVRGYMRKIFCWLCKNSEPISHWATALALVAAAVGGFMAYGQLKITSAQLEQANEQRRWQNYNEMNVRYAQLYESIPDQIISGCVPDDFKSLEPKTKRWVRQYFDLYSEEYWLFVNNLIPKEMWTRRIHGGVRVNLSKYPALIEGYSYWKAAGSFTHPDDFQLIAESAIKDAKSPPYAKKPSNSCGSNAAPNTSLNPDAPKRDAPVS